MQAVSDEQLQVERLKYALTQILEGRFRYNMGDYETCAKNAARLALDAVLDPAFPERERQRRNKVNSLLAETVTQLGA